MSFPDPSHWIQEISDRLRARDFKAADDGYPMAMSRLLEFEKHVTAEELGWRASLSTSAHLRYAYAEACADAGVPERGLPKLGELAHALAGFRNSDDYFLIARGMITLEAFCDLAVKLYPQTASNPIWPKLLRELQSKLDDDGRSFIHELRQRLAHLAL
jgi:hypothetical protein